MQLPQMPKCGQGLSGSFYDIVSVTDCRIVDADYRSILKCVRADAKMRTGAFYFRRSAFNDFQKPSLGFSFPDFIHMRITEVS